MNFCWKRVGTWVLTTALLAACAEADRSQIFDTVTSPHGDYILNAIVIEPWIPQGPYFVALDLTSTKNATPQRLIKTELAYDGVPFTRKNIGVRWTADYTALVCLRASDRPDQGVQITVHGDGTAVAQLRTGC